MSWIDKIHRIVVLNLLKKQDRLLQITEHFEEYDIPFQRYSAIENERGAEGLKDTMIELFKDCIEKNMQYVLVFEDDAFCVVQKQVLHNTMNNVLNNLPENWGMCFLGAQVTGKFTYRHTENILSAVKIFSTHSVLYSLKGMKEILAQGIYAPIDNFYVEKIEPLHISYIAYPLLFSQKEGYSDICKQTISWRPFIDGSYNQRYNEFNG